MQFCSSIGRNSVSLLGANSKMKLSFLLWLFSFCVPVLVVSSSSKPCPSHWLKYYSDMKREGHFVCYKFVRSPRKSYREAKELCKIYGAKLMTLDARDEYKHIFVKMFLTENDPIRTNWYVGISLSVHNSWVTEDGRELPGHFLSDFVPEQKQTTDRRYLAYGYSYQMNDWGFLPTQGDKQEAFICEMSSEDLRHFPAAPENILSHEFGISDVKDPKFIPRGPKIDKEPEPAIFDLLKRDLINQTSFTCFAEAYPFPTYEWYKERGNSLTNSATKINPLGDTRLTVSGGTLIVGGPKEYFVEVRMYWNRDFFPNFVEEDQRTLVSFDGNLYFSYLDTIDQGLYSCTVQSTVSDIGRHGPFFRIEVNPGTSYQQLTFANNFPKAFPHSPISGDDVRLECIAFGYPIPSYSWFRRNGKLPRKARLLNHNRVLLIPGIGVSDFGHYVCTAENARVLIEGSVHLYIQTKPTFTIPLKDKFVTFGDSVTFECEAFAVPDVDYYWFVNSRIIDSDLILSSDGKYQRTNGLLKIINVTTEDEAMYQCKTINQLGSAFSSAQLKILALAPTFKNEDPVMDFYATESLGVTLPCRPQASPFPSFVWEKENQIIHTASGERVFLLPNGDLRIYPVGRSDEGRYNCTATNKFNSSSRLMHLTVFGKPMEREDEERVAYAGGDLILNCYSEMADFLESVYFWRINGVPVRMQEEQNRLRDIDYYQDISFPSNENMDRAKEYYRTRAEPYKRGDHPGQLIIQSVKQQDAGMYSCDVITPISSFLYFIEVKVLGPPGVVGGVIPSDVTSTIARLRWTNGHDNGFFITGYTVKGQILISGVWITKFVIEVAAQNTSRFNVKECFLPEKTLIPFSTYRFQVAASNSLGRGQYSFPSPSINTKSDVPFLTPTNIGGGGGKIGDLTIVWDPLERVHYNAPGIYYIVYWRLVPDHQVQHKELEDFQRRNLSHRGNIGMFVTSVEKEYFYTQFEVKVQTANKKGLGPISEPVVIYSAENFPQVQATDIKAFAYNATALNITWKPIRPSREEVRGKLIGYRLKYWSDGRDEAEAKIRLSRRAESHGLVVGLAPDTHYWVRVMAYNSAGSGPESEKFRERTWRYPPLMPPNAIQVKPIDPEKVHVRWRGVTTSALEEAILGYKVRVWKDFQDITEARDMTIYLGSPLECIVSGLELGEIYKLRVLAFSNGGDGKMSSPAVRFSMGDLVKLRATDRASHQFDWSSVVPIPTLAILLSKYF